MIEPLTLRAMRDELSTNEKLAATLKRKETGKGVPVTALFPKIATAGHGQPPPHQYEEMNKARLMQTLKDVPIVILGTAGGYAAGRTAAEYLLPHLIQSPQAQEQFRKALPTAAAIGGGLGSTLLAAQRHMLRERRDRAAREAQEREARGPVNTDAPQPQTPPNSPPPKTAGAPAPRIAQAKRTDPWREDSRNPPFML